MLAAGSQFLREKADVIGIAERLLEEESRLLQISAPCQAFDVPERANRKRSLPALESTVRAFQHIVSMHQRIVHQALVDDCERRAPLRVAWSDELHHRHQQR